ncbi:MAG: hypothetical protein AB7S26_25780 [Sandaracinaceae bacterium]
MIHPLLRQAFARRSSIARIPLIVITVVIVGVAGCGPGVSTPTSGPPAIASASTEDQSCSRDSECVLVQDCCGCERQGRQLAVHRDRVEALTASAQSDCSAVSCTVGASEHRSCGAERAQCLGGRCVPAVQ